MLISLIIDNTLLEKNYSKNDEGRRGGRGSKEESNIYNTYVIMLLSLMLDKCLSETNH